MKKIFLILFIFSLMGCPPKDSVISDAGMDVIEDVLVCDDVVQEKDNILTIDNWQLILPIEWVERPLSSDSQDIALLAFNEKDQGMVLLIKESYEGCLDEYSIETIRGLRGQEADILITASLQSNEDPFVYIKSRQGGLIAETWVTVKDGFGYSLNCGGVETNSKKLSKDCQDIFSSFEVR